MECEKVIEWTGVNEACCIKRFDCSSRTEKCCTRTRTFMVFCLHVAKCVNFIEISLNKWDILPLDMSPVLDVKSKRILRIADGYFLVMKCINLSKDFKEIGFYCWNKYWLSLKWSFPARCELWAQSNLLFVRNSKSKGKAAKDLKQLDQVSESGWLGKLNHNLMNCESCNLLRK